MKVIKSNFGSERPAINGLRLAFLVCSPLLFILCSYCSVKADENKVNVFMNAPDWNGKQVCDGGSGAVVSPVNAPSISISMEANTEVPDNFYFDFVWEKKVNDGTWQAAKGENNATLVPAFEPGTLINDDPQGRLLKMSWRLRVRSTGSSEWFTSAEYSVSIVARMRVTHVVNNSGNPPSIDLTVIGGMPVKNYQWTSMSKGGSFPKNQRTVEDPKNLTPGIYQVVIKDECQEIKYTIEIQDLSKNK